MTDEVPAGTHHRQPPERDRLTTRGRSTDDGSFTTLLVIHESDGSWVIHSLGAPGIRLARADMVAVCEAILERAR